MLPHKQIDRYMHENGITSHALGKKINMETKSIDRVRKHGGTEKSLVKIANGLGMDVMVVISDVDASEGEG